MLKESMFIFMIDDNLKGFKIAEKLYKKPIDKIKSIRY